MSNPGTTVAFLVVSCDRYADLWLPYFHCLFKYWPDCPYPIYLGSNAASYSDPRVTTLPIGPDRDYSSNLMSMLDKIPNEWVITSLEDHFISKTVNTTRVQRIISAVQMENGGYLKLTGDYPVSYEAGPMPDIGPIPKGVRYRVSFTLAFWKKSVLRQLLRKGETAWDIERNGTPRSDEFVEPFFAISADQREDPPLHRFHGVVRGKWVRDAPAFLHKEGLDACIPSRDLLPWKSELYNKAYAWRLSSYMAARRHWWRS